MDKVVLSIMGGTIILIVAIFLFASKNPANQPPLGQEIEIQPATHISAGEVHPDYNSNPPTSGWHYVDPAPWGVSTEPIVDEQAIHNLEHGGIWLSYHPDQITQETLDQLTTLVRTYPSKVFLSPRAGNDTPIAIASWGRLEKTETFDEAQIRDFVARNKNKGPEQIPD